MDAELVEYSPTRQTDRPNVTSSPKAVQIQRTIAFGVVVLPLFGACAALYAAGQGTIALAEVGIFVGMYFVGMLGITLGFHRCFAHRSFKAGPVLRAFLAILGSMSAQGPLLWWVATHRCHHAYSDQPGDPHSPHLIGPVSLTGWRGFWHGHIGWMFSEEQADWVRFCPELIKEPLLFRVHRLYPLWLLIGLLIPTLLGGLLIGGAWGFFSGFLWGGLVRIFCVNHALWCVGSISHLYGGRPFQHRTLDQSANNWFVALVAFGEGNQNNHHAFPSSAKHGIEWWQPDFTYRVIGLLGLLGWIRDIKSPTKSTLEMAARRPTVGSAVLTK